MEQFQLRARFLDGTAGQGQRMERHRAGLPAATDTSSRHMMANMTGAGDWRRHVTLLLEGIRGPERADNLCE